MFKLSCDYCESELASGEGAPDSHKKHHVYCKRCSLNVGRVDQAVKDEQERRVIGVHSDLEDYRNKMILELMPQQTLPKDASPADEAGHHNTITNDQRSVTSGRGRRIIA